MGFEAFGVRLTPKKDSPLHGANTIEAVHTLIQDIRKRWPAFCVDAIEMAHAFPPLKKDEIILVHETPAGLFQLYPRLSETGDVIVWIEASYANPRSVYEPFLAVAEGLMQRYDMTCHFPDDFAPGQQDVPDEIEPSTDLRAILIPAIDYNREFWRGDFGTEEAILRPGDAVARFVTPHLVPMESLQKA